MHRVLAPSRLAIVKPLAGQGTLSIREIARRVDRDVQAVHRDVTALVNAGVIDRTEKGVEFPYDRIHFEYDVSLVACTHPVKTADVCIRRAMSTVLGSSFRWGDAMIFFEEQFELLDALSFLSQL
jgi:DNA-binding Lrp family transcriptional regulator